MNESGIPKVRVTFVIEWANTTYNGIPRFWGLMEILSQQWQDLQARNYPETLGPDAIDYLDHIDSSPEIIIVSGEQISPDIDKRLRGSVPDHFDLSIRIKPGLEYYALKNFGAELASGDLICFLDSDVHPDKEWLAHLLGTFSRPDVYTVSGQPYVAPVDLFSTAFALGWTYQLADETGRIFMPKKFYANNLAFRSEVLNQTRFPKLDRRTRGAASLLGVELVRLGYPVWENRMAKVDHPAPSSFKHMAIRALAHGRDYYMKDTEDRSLRGLVTSQRVSCQRLARGITNTYHNWRKVGLKRAQTPIVIAIIATYYGLFSLGGILTHLNPEAAGRRFRL